MSDNAKTKPGSAVPAAKALAEVMLDTKLTAQQKLQRRFAVLAALMEKRT
ncbi:hypothetical protein [Bradyrhizobium sp. CCBAU 21365]|nr:hypothetical protein [Bradyrhizobium sp. CCBAU 21365]